MRDYSINAVARERYQMAKRLGLCPMCKKNTPKPGRVSCQECMDKREALRKERTRKRIAARLCTVCGNPLPVTDAIHKLCPDCRRYMAAYTRLRREGGSDGV